MKRNRWSSEEQRGPTHQTVFNVYGFCVPYSTKYNRNTKNHIKWATISNTMKMMQNIILFRYNCLLNWFQLNGYEESANECVCLCVFAAIVLNAINLCYVRTMDNKINVYVSVCWHVVCFVLGAGNHSNWCVQSITVYYCMCFDAIQCCVWIKNRIWLFGMVEKRRSL